MECNTRVTAKCTPIALPRGQESHSSENIEVFFQNHARVKSAFLRKKRQEIKICAHTKWQFQLLVDLNILNETGDTYVDMSGIVAERSSPTVPMSSLQT